MTVAVICLASKLNPNAEIVDEFNKRVKGDVLRIIGFDDKRKDLKKYEKIFVMYQNSPSEIPEEFMNFCNEYKDDLTDATLVVTHPVYDPKDNSTINGTISDIETFYKDFWCDIIGCEDKRKMILATDNGNKKLVEFFSQKIGCKWNYLSKRNYDLYGNSLIVCPYVFTIEGERMSNANARIAMAIGAALVIATISVMIISFLYGAGGAVGRIGILGIIGGLMIYGGKRNIENNLWNPKNELKETKSRDVAMALNFIPGLGHIYLGEVRKGTILLSITIIMGTFMVASLFTQLLYIVEVVIYLVLFVFAHIIICFIDVEQICNKSGTIGNVMSAFGFGTDMDPRNVELYRAAAVILFGSSFLFTSLICLLKIPEHFFFNLLISIVSSVAVIVSAVECKRKIRPRPLVFDIKMTSKLKSPRTVIIHALTFSSSTVRRLSYRFSADVVNISKLSAKVPTDLSAYDLILVEYSLITAH